MADTRMLNSGLKTAQPHGVAFASGQKEPARSTGAFKLDSNFEIFAFHDAFKLDSNFEILRVP